MSQRLLRAQPDLGGHGLEGHRAQILQQLLGPLQASVFQKLLGLQPVSC